MKTSMTMTPNEQNAANREQDARFLKLCQLAAVKPVCSDLSEGEHEPQFDGQQVSLAVKNYFAGCPELTGRELVRIARAVNSNAGLLAALEDCRDCLIASKDSGRSEVLLAWQKKAINAGYEAIESAKGGAL